MRDESKEKRQKANAQGAHAEALAERYLCDQGLNPITKNFRCKVGEIDLIMNDNECITFIEVKYRKSNAYGGAAESVTKPKQRKVRLAAQVFIQMHSQYSRSPFRFDVLAIDGEEINWIQNAF